MPLGSLRYTDLTAWLAGEWIADPSSEFGHFAGIGMRRCW